MYIIVPLSLILLSAVGIFWIVWRKIPSLDKLAASDQGFNGANLDIRSGSWKDLFSDFFPEAHEGLEKLKLKEHLVLWLLELEKSLRKMRLFFLKIDRLSESLIKKIRLIHLSNKPYNEVQAKPEIIKRSSVQSASIKPREEISQFDLSRKEEQRLILEIAKNPKDPNLYDILGDTYMRMKNFEDAKESYEAAIELNPGNNELLKKRSQAVEKVVK